MLACATYALPLGVSSTALGWLEFLLATLGVVTIGVQAWKLWQMRRHHAVELAEHARSLAEVEDRIYQSLREKETLIRESQAKSEMLATLSREVRSNLNGIVGAADLMLDASLSPVQREHLSTMRASAEALHQSLNDILDYSSIETGKLRIEYAPFTLHDPLIEVVEHLSPLAVLKGLELVLIIAQDVPRQVTGDAARLRQILLNLMSNSIRFTPSGRVVLRVELPQGSKGSSAQGTTWLHFSVNDTGPGIPEDQQATVFDRYAQSGSQSPRKFGGSGLALAISKRLVELMGGNIGVRQLPDTGSEFWVVMPLAVDRNEGPPPPPQPRDIHAVVLDDLAASRVAISTLLNQLGIEQDGADTMAEAGELLRDARESGAHNLALLLDESVAEGSADEVNRLLADPALTQSTRVILMTMNPESAVANRRFPVSTVLRKPVLRADLLMKALKAPLRKEGAVAEVRDPVARSGEPTSAARKGPRVLLVDDDEISRSITAQLLERLGCSVDRAVSGAEAIEQTRQIKFDLILMDCQMPEMNGFVATERILAAKPVDAPPIVALTASTTVKDREKCFAAGMCDFVDKPVRMAELERILKRWTRSEPTPLG